MNHSIVSILEHRDRAMRLLDKEKAKHMEEKHDAKKKGEKKKGDK